MDKEIKTIVSKYGYQETYSALYKELLSDYLYLSDLFRTPVKCIYGIYSNNKNTCIYIGCSLNFQNRISWHHYESNLYPKRKLYKSILQSGGWDKYSFRILENLEDITGIFEKETMYIQKLSPIANTLLPPNKLLQVEVTGRR